MKIQNLQTWEELMAWLDDAQWSTKTNGHHQFAFRGQSDSSWSLRNSLARHFGNNNVNTDQWRTRELKMYQMFRERLLELCPRVYDEWAPRDIIALMQHFGLPTRMIDFTYCNRVAAWFALRYATGPSAIWVINRSALDERMNRLGLLDYCGPTHRPKYMIFHKDEQGQYKKVGSVLDARPNDRLAAQQGCFLVPGSISRIIDVSLVYEKVILSERIAIESRSQLSELGSEDRLFPDLSKLATEVKMFSITGDENYPIH